MATYFIVGKKGPLGPNEIRAGSTIDVSNGDVFIFTAAANDNVKFESATGNALNFEIRFETSNANDFNVEIMENLDVGIVISSAVDLSNVDIDADKALSVILTAGDDVSLGKFTGSADGVDVVTIGNGFTTDHDIQLKGGDNYLTIGDDATIRSIIAEEGADTITIGDGLTADDIDTGEGADALTIGDGATLDNIDTGKGDDTVTIGNDLAGSSGNQLEVNSIDTGDGNDVLTIRNNAIIDDIDTGKGNDTIDLGDNLIANDIKTGEGADSLTIGDNAVVDDIDTGKGDDTVSVGDFFTADKLETKDGDDLVIVGSNASINDLDGGDGNDELDSDTYFPDATGFEIICFARRTLIETDHGNVPIEKLRPGDLVRTLDHGMQPIRWISSTEVSGLGVHAPIRIAAGALGNGRALWVSQQHRMFFSGWEVELHFGDPEVLIAAKHLVCLPGIDLIELPEIEYFHMLFDQHEIVYAEGIESESFHPGAVGLGTLTETARAEISALFPALATDPNAYGESARMSLKSFESFALLG